MDSRSIAREVAGRLIAHRNQLAGKAEDADRTHEALSTAARTVERHHGDHRSGAAGASSHWEGRAADGFDRRARRLTKALRSTATAADRGAEVVAGAAATLRSNHRAVSHLVEEYTTSATRVLDAARAVTGAGGRAALVRAAGQVADLVRSYTNESTRHVRAVHNQLTDAAKELRRLERGLESDGYADQQQDKPKERDRDERSPLRDKIRDVARDQLGYREGAGNSNKYGPAGPWCSNFATWVWRKSGVEIGILPFTGDVYEWGQRRQRAAGVDLDGHTAGRAAAGDLAHRGCTPP